MSLTERQISCALTITYTSTSKKNNLHIKDNNKLHMYPSINASKKLKNKSKMNNVIR